MVPLIATEETVRLVPPTLTSKRDLFGMEVESSSSS